MPRSDGSRGVLENKRSDDESPISFVSSYQPLIKLDTLDDVDASSLEPGRYDVSRLKLSADDLKAFVDTAAEDAFVYINTNQLPHLHIKRPDNILKVRLMPCTSYYESLRAPYFVSSKYRIFMNPYYLLHLMQLGHVTCSPLEKDPEVPWDVLISNVNTYFDSQEFKSLVSSPVFQTFCEDLITFMGPVIEHLNPDKMRSDLTRFHYNYIEKADIWTDMNHFRFSALSLYLYAKYDQKPLSELLTNNDFLHDVLKASASIESLELGDLFKLVYSKGLRNFTELYLVNFFSTHVSHKNLSGVDFSGLSSISSVSDDGFFKFINCNLSSVTFPKSKGLKFFFEECDLRGATFEFDQVVIESCSVYPEQVNPSLNKNIDFSMFSEDELKQLARRDDLNLKYAKLNRYVLEKLYEAGVRNFQDVELFGEDFSSLTLDDSDFTGSFARGNINFESSSLLCIKGAILSRGSDASIDLTGAKMDTSMVEFVTKSIDFNSGMKFTFDLVGLRDFTRECTECLGLRVNLAPFIESEENQRLIDEIDVSKIQFLRADSIMPWPAYLQLRNKFERRLDAFRAYFPPDFSREYMSACRSFFNFVNVRLCKGVFHDLLALGYRSFEGGFLVGVHDLVVLSEYTDLSWKNLRIQGDFVLSPSQLKEILAQNDGQLPFSGKVTVASSAENVIDESFDFRNVSNLIIDGATLTAAQIQQLYENNQLSNISLSDDLQGWMLNLKVLKNLSLTDPQLQTLVDHEFEPTVSERGSSFIHNQVCSRHAEWAALCEKMSRFNVDMKKSHPLTVNSDQINLRGKIHRNVDFTSFEGRKLIVDELTLLKECRVSLSQLKMIAESLHEGGLRYRSQNFSFDVTAIDFSSTPVLKELSLSTPGSDILVMNDDERFPSVFYASHCAFSFNQLTFSFEQICQIYQSYNEVKTKAFDNINLDRGRLSDYRVLDRGGSSMRFNFMGKSLHLDKLCRIPGIVGTLHVQDALFVSDVLFVWYGQNYKEGPRFNVATCETQKEFVSAIERLGLTVVENPEYMYFYEDNLSMLERAYKAICAAQVKDRVPAAHEDFSKKPILFLLFSGADERLNKAFELMVKHKFNFNADNAQLVWDIRREAFALSNTFLKRQFNGEDCLFAWAISDSVPAVYNPAGDELTQVNQVKACLRCTSVANLSPVVVSGAGGCMGAGAAAGGSTSVLMQAVARPSSPVATPPVSPAAAPGAGGGASKSLVNSLMSQGRPVDAKRVSETGLLPDPDVDGNGLEMARLSHV